MDKTIKAKWIKALRSGRYRQTMDYLENEGAYCCLGVLCKVQRKSIEAIQTEDGLQELPRSLQFQWGIPKAAHSQLIKMNDSGKSFAAIADWIEAHL